MDKRTALKKLNAHWITNCSCDLRKQCTQAVLGDGNIRAKILFIGEAPGKNEDEQGKPFIGAAGKFLSEMLASISLKREDVYITNIVKYRPPNNRDPLPEEIVACAPWLHEEIALIRPHIIITLGRHALTHFLPGKKISSMHGQLFQCPLPDIGKQTFFALYHPAAALYNGGMRQTLINDFKKIPSILRTIKKEGPTK
ncbi:MAG: uracil-DNA glycosylase [Candidatus Moranbacteria bacterium]|nr:uracil-DNA glycosylase [Candidatus Moranbacteria bacterium]